MLRILLVLSLIMVSVFGKIAFSNPIAGLVKTRESLQKHKSVIHLRAGEIIAADVVINAGGNRISGKRVLKVGLGATVAAGVGLVILKGAAAVPFYGLLVPLAVGLAFLEYSDRNRVF